MSLERDPSRSRAAWLLLVGGALLCSAVARGADHRDGPKITDINNTIAGLVMAHVVLAIPLVTITVLSGLKAYDMNQELVARSLGASRLRAFLFITVPQIRFSIVSGALFAFITSFDEAVVSFFISGGETSTLTRRMFSALRDQIDPTIAAISTCLIVLSVLLIVLAQLFGRKRTP